MAANPSLISISSPAQAGTKPGALGILRAAAANEFVFAVVGHVGSGTREIAESLKAVMSEEKAGEDRFEVFQLKSSEVIIEYAQNLDSADTFTLERASPCGLRRHVRHAHAIYIENLGGFGTVCLADADNSFLGLQINNVTPHKQAVADTLC